MKFTSAAQNWAHGAPIFFRNGIRVNLESGYNMLARGLFGFGDAPELDDWFKENTEITACDSPFFIADDSDAPNEKTLVQAQQYISESLAGWGEVNIGDHSTRIEDFGFVVTKLDTGDYSFVKKGESVATYYLSGLPREWQGETSFVLKPWYFVKRKRVKRVRA